MIQVCWRGLSQSKNTVESLVKVYEDVSALVLKLLRRKNAPKDLVATVRRQLQLA